MALGDAYVTAAELKTYLGITDAVDDTAITNAVNTASRSIEKFCGRQFNKTTAASARVYSPDFCHLVDVDDFHTTTDLVIKTDHGDDGTFEITLASTDYQLEPLNGISDGESGWPYHRIRAIESEYFPVSSRRATVQVTAQWGWTAVPASVKQATFIIASETFKLASAPFGVAGVGNWGMIRVRNNPMAMSLLAPYRRYPVLVA